MKSAALLARSNSPSALLAEALAAIFPGDTVFEVFLLELFFALTKESPRWKRTSGLPWWGFFRERKEKLQRSEEHTSELQSQSNLVCRLLLEKKKTMLSIVAP